MYVSTCELTVISQMTYSLILHQCTLTDILFVNQGTVIYCLSVKVLYVNQNTECQSAVMHNSS